MELQRGAASRLAAQGPCPTAAFANDGLPAEALDVHWEETSAQLRQEPKDPRLDPDEFKRGPGRKPQGWVKAVSLASDVHLSFMRVLLEVHYDEMYEKRPPLRGGVAGSVTSAPRAKRRTREYRLNHKVVNMLFSKRHEQMQLPQSVKCVLQKPQDERTWANLERLREAVLATVEGTRDVHLWESAVVEEVARSIVDNVCKAILAPLGRTCAIHATPKSC